MEHWELAAREAIRDTYARYNHAGDSFRLDELAACFLADGVLEVRGQEPYVGRDEIIRNLGGGRGSSPEEARALAAANAPPGEPPPRRIVRHFVTNLVIQELTPERARSAAYFLVMREHGVDHYGRYRDELVAVNGSWYFAHRFVGVDWFAATGPTR